MASLPTPGASSGTWATQLNTFLGVAHNTDGTLVNHLAASVQTGNCAAIANQYVPVDTTSGSVTVTLPSAPANGTQALVKMIVQGYTSGVPNTVTVATSGSDVLNKSGGSTTTTLKLLSQGIFLEYSSGIWSVVSDDLPLGQLDNRYPFVYNVKSYGATGNGATDDTSAIQAAINAATGSASPASNTRTPLASVYFPPGTYVISSDLVIQSVSGFRLTGAGPEQVIIKASGTGFTTAVLLIDGSYSGIYEGFTIAGDGTEQVTDGIRLDWTTAAHRSTTGNCFRDIRVRNLNFVTGISLEGNGSRQLDGTTFMNVLVNGGQTAGSWSSSGNWQNAFAFGNGTFGNNYDHRGLGVDAIQCYYGYKINASSMMIDGAQPNSNGYDFYTLAGAQCSFRNIQSQNSGQFLTKGSSFTPAPVSFEDCEFASNNLNPGLVLCSITGGVFHFTNFTGSNVQVASNLGTYVLGTFNLSGASSTRPATVNFDNLTMNGARSSCIIPGTWPVDISVRNYKNYAPQTGVFTALAAGDALSIYTGGNWINVDSFVSAAVPSVQWVTATGSYTWSKPLNAQTVDVVLCSGGGGGGSGAVETTGTVAGGGGGGGGGSLMFRTFVAADLPSSVTGTVGAGGSGGTAVTGTTGTPGVNGSYGNNTTFGNYCVALFGVYGNGGTTSGGSGGGTVIGTSIGGSGGTGGSTAAGGLSINAAGPTGGGGGGGVNSGGTAFGGGAGNYSLNGNSSNTGSGGVAGGASPGTGTSPSVKGTPGCGGGGGAGASGSSPTAQSGATPFYGGGGGGGGGAAGSGTLTSGAGGAGGNGFALIITHFT